LKRIFELEGVRGLDT